MTLSCFLLDTSWPFHFYGPRAADVAEMLLREAAADGWTVIRCSHVREVGVAHLLAARRVVVVVPAVGDAGDPAPDLARAHEVQSMRGDLAVLGVTEGDDVPKAWKFYAKMRARVDEFGRVAVVKDLTRMLGHQGRTFRVEHDGE